MKNHDPRAALAVCAAAALGTLPLPSIAQQKTAESGPLEEIIVTSSMIEQPRRQVATAVSVIDSVEIALRGYPDLAELLRTQTGIAASNSGGPGQSTTVRIRGEEGYRTMLIIDGIKTVDAGSPQVGPNFDSLLTTSDMQRIEVLRGPQGFMYGADAGGVVNVISKTGIGDFGGQLGIEYGEFDTRRIDAAVSGGSDRGDYFVSATEFRTDGFNAQTADSVLQDKDGVDNTTLHAKLGLNLSDNVRLQFVARDVDAATLFDGCFTAAFDPTHDCRETSDQKTYKLSADVKSGDVSNTFGYSDVDIEREDFAAGASTFKGEGKIKRFDYLGSVQPSKELALVYGLDFERDGLASDPDRYERDQKGYFVEYEGAFIDRVFVSAGARYDESDDFGNHTSTRVSGAYVQDLGSDRSLKYRATWGTGFRAPSPFEITYNSGPFAFPPAAGTTLKEETSEGYDLGIDYDAAHGLHFEITYFDQQIDDQIVFDLVDFSGYLQVPGVSHSKGEELGADVPFGRGFVLLANWTHNETDDRANAQRLRRPKNVANFGLMYTAPSNRLALLASYRLSRDAVDIGATPLPNYAVLDLSVNYAVREKLELFARVENATDEQYEEVIGYNTAGRSLYGGIRWHF